jgi:hypothetical protein
MVLIKIESELHCLLCYVVHTKCVRAEELIDAVDARKLLTIANISRLN